MCCSKTYDFFFPCTVSSGFNQQRCWVCDHNSVWVDLSLAHVRRFFETIQNYPKARGLQSLPNPNLLCSPPVLSETFYFLLVCCSKKYQNISFILHFCFKLILPGMVIRLFNTTWKTLIIANLLICSSTWMISWIPWLSQLINLFTFNLQFSMNFAEISRKKTRTLQAKWENLKEKKEK